MTRDLEKQPNVTKQDSYASIGSMIADMQARGGELPSRFFPNNNSDSEIVKTAKARINLADEIGWAFTKAGAAQDILNFPKQNSHQVKLNSISCQLGRAIKSFKSNDALEKLILQHADVQPPADFLDMLETLQKAVDATSRISGQTLPLKPSKLTLQARIILELAKVYEAEFGLSAERGIKAKWHDHHGPFVEFVQHCFEIDGRPRLSSVAMTKALQRSILKMSRDSG